MMKKIIITLMALVVLTGMVSAFSGAGSGTIGDPYIITTPSQLNETRLELNASYALGNDIDMTSWRTNNITGWTDWGYPGPTGTNGTIGYGFRPIGYGQYAEDDSSCSATEIQRQWDCSSFLGSFDGRGYSIINLTIHMFGGYDYTGYGSFGLFAGIYQPYDGQATPQTWVKNLTFINPNITVENNIKNGYGASYVGVLAGMFDHADMYDVHVINGVVDAPTSYGVGGLVGGTWEQAYDNFSSSTIKIYNSSFDGDVFAYSDGIGGLIGFASISGSAIEIIDSYTSGTIVMTRNTTTLSTWYAAGGLMGNLDLEGPNIIKNSYSTMDVYGSSAGGIGGGIRFGDTTIDNVYFAGNLYVWNSIGKSDPLAGSTPTGTITCDFFAYDAGKDDDNPYISQCEQNGTADGKSTSEMLAKSSWVEWDENIWEFNTGNYPYLDVQSYVPELSLISSVTAISKYFYNSTMSGADVWFDDTTGNVIQAVESDYWEEAVPFRKFEFNLENTVANITDANNTYHGVDEYNFGSLVDGINGNWWVADNGQYYDVWGDNETWDGGTTRLALDSTHMFRGIDVFDDAGYGEVAVIAYRNGIRTYSRTAYLDQEAIVGGTNNVVGVAVDPTTEYAYMFSTFNPSIMVANVNNPGSIGIVALHNGVQQVSPYSVPGDVAFDLMKIDGKYLFTSGGATGDVNAYNITSGLVHLWTQSQGTGTYSLAINTWKNKVFVAEDNLIHVYDFDGIYQSTIEPGLGYIWGIDFDDEWDFMYVSGTEGLKVFGLSGAVPDTTAPTIVLDYPSNGSTVGIVNDYDDVDFKWTATDDSYSVFTCDFYLDGILNESGVVVASGIQETVTKVLTRGSYNWSVACADGAANSDQSSIYYFTIPDDVTAPNITIVNPVDNFTTENPLVTFEAYVVDAGYSNLSCAITANGDSVWAGTVNSGTYLNQTINVGRGRITWDITCLDGSANSRTTSSRFMLVEYIKHKFFAIDYAGGNYTVILVDDLDVQSNDLLGPTSDPTTTIKTGEIDITNQTYMIVTTDNRGAFVANESECANSSVSSHAKVKIYNSTYGLHYTLTVPNTYADGYCSQPKVNSFIYDYNIDGYEDVGIIWATVLENMTRTMVVKDLSNMSSGTPTLYYYTSTNTMDLNRDGANLSKVCYEDGVAQFSSVSNTGEVIDWSNCYSGSYDPAPTNDDAILIHDIRSGLTYTYAEGTVGSAYASVFDWNEDGVIDVIRSVNRNNVTALSVFMSGTGNLDETSYNKAYCLDVNSLLKLTSSIIPKTPVVNFLTSADSNADGYYEFISANSVYDVRRKNVVHSFGSGSGWVLPVDINGDYILDLLYYK